MRAVVQRVKRGSVQVDGKSIAEIGRGYVILLGVGPADTDATAAALAKKISLLRVFEDEQGKMNLSIQDVGGQALVVSQFTLYADTSRGNRPSFINAAAPETASPLVQRFAAHLAGFGIPVQQGEFGAHMLVDIENDGPVTIWFEF
ncbi:MAG: D-tyrosyl-tRNA(Tyr) deacylase [Chloroflexi bacterium]|nr:MAG: D-tyrosyl-tRNA(Tyr) deacylase [Chloroflexota bacterium]